MNISIQHKYLTFPVNNDASLKKIRFYLGDRLVYDLDCKLDLIAPDFTAHVDMSRFAGQELRMEIDPHMDVPVGFADVLAPVDCEAEFYRPQVHFSVIQGWNNDPNGLLYADGVYHMFYQYNPCATEWGNMHWGHAVSTDLLHWQEKDVALYPDEMGTMFSGGGIEDTHNVSGLGDGVTPPLLFYYTAAGGTGEMSAGKKFTQCLAYSTDGGKTLQKYAHNPIVDHIEGENRDPKVIWVEELGKYVMALFMARNEYTLFTSEDLLHWQPLQTVAFDKERECPDLFCLTFEGERYWVLMGASDYYLVGRFTKEGFQAVQPQMRLNASRFSYAAQSFSGLENGRVLRVSWDRIKIPHTRASQQMGFPVEMSLRREGNTLVLCAAPAGEIASLYEDTQAYEGAWQDGELRLDTQCRPLDMTLVLPADEAAVIKLRLYGAVMTVDTVAKRIHFGSTRLPYVTDGKQLTLRLLVDRASVEAFVCGGKHYFAEQHLTDRNLPYVSLMSNKPLSHIELQAHTLKSIY